MPSTILIVDDDEDQHVILRTLLCHYGYATLHARSLAQAYAILAREHTLPDLVVLDIRLPGEHGLDLLNVLHLNDPALPVVVCTSDVLAAHRYPAAAEAVAAWTVKPIPTSNILEIIARLVPPPA